MPRRERTKRAVSLMIPALACSAGAGSAQAQPITPGPVASALASPAANIVAVPFMGGVVVGKLVKALTPPETSAWARVAAGAATGAALGAAIGTVVPGLGNAAGAAIGALFGGIGAWMA